MDIIGILKALKDDKSRLIDSTLQFVRLEQHSSLQDVAKIHLISAEQAFISATRSNNPEVEMRVGIGHLRDAFNAFNVYLDKGFRGPWGLYYLKWRKEPETEIQLKLASIALIISILYEQLLDESNQILWKNTGISIANYYISNRPIAIKDWEYATGVYKSVTSPLNSRYYHEINFIKNFEEVIRIL